MNDVLEMILIVPCVVVSLRCILHAIIWFEYERPIEKAWHGVGLGSGALVLYLRRLLLLVNLRSVGSSPP
jgi:hypothetical protein